MKQPRMKRMQLLNFDDLYKQQCILLCHDCINGRAPQQIANLLVSEQTTNLYPTRNRTANPLNLKIPNLKTRVGSNSFQVKGPAAWNEIATEIKSVDRREIFKSTIKRMFLYRYTQKTECKNPRCTDHRFHIT